MDKDKIIERPDNLEQNWFLENARDGFLSLDDELRVTYFNRAAEGFLGRNRAEVIGKCLFDVFPEARGSVFEVNYLTAVEERKTLEFEYYLPPHDAWYEVRISPTPAGVYVYFRVTTERKLAEQALRESEETLRTVFDSVHDAILLHTPGGAIVDFNEKFLHMYAVSRQQAKNLTIADISGPDMLVASMQEIWRKTLTGKEQLFEWQARRGDGSLFDVEVFLCRLQMRGRDFILANLRDITGRKRMEAALRQSEERYRLIADFTFNWEYWLDPQGRLIYVSPSCENLTGFPPGRFKEDPAFLASIIHAGDRDSYIDHQRKVLQKSGSANLEFRIVNSRGEQRWLSHVCRPVYGKEGQFLGQLASNQDITERKGVEQQLQLFAQLINQSNDAISVLDLESGKLILVNDKACHDLQYTREELLAMHPEDISTRPPGYFTGHFQDLRQSGAILIEDVHRRKDGTTFPVEVSVRFTEVNRRQYVVAVTRDISERKRMEQEIQKRQRLESLGLLAGGIAHDFNNILAGILGNIELARTSLPPVSDAAHRLSRAEQAAVRAGGLTQQLLTFARGGGPIKKRISLPQLVQKAVASALPEAGVAWQGSFPADLWPLEADERQLQQAISNLLKNAVQAMPAGGTIEISATNEGIKRKNRFGLAEGNYVRIAVKDQGTGIPKDYLETIFDPYFTTKEKGSGLGLSIAFSIAKRHGGTITVDSTPGQGSTFSIFLPAMRT